LRKSRRICGAIYFAADADEELLRAAAGIDSGRKEKRIDLWRFENPGSAAGPVTGLIYLLPVADKLIYYWPIHAVDLPFDRIAAVNRY
jgi:hypothetical protein